MRIEDWATVCAFCVCALWWSPGAHAQAAVRVVTDPPGADIEVDGRPVGRGEALVGVGPGEHVVRASMAARETVEERVRVGAGDTLTVRLALPLAPGRVRVVGLPDGAAVTTPGWEIVGGEASVPPGVSTLEVRVPGLPLMSARFDVEAGAVTTIEYGDVFSPRGFVSNFYIPGSAQIRQGRPVAGGAYAAGVGLGIAGALATAGPIANADEDFAAAIEVYDAATSEAEVRAARADMDAAYDRARATRALRVGLFATAFGVYVASILDGAAHYGRRPGLRVLGPDPAPEWSLRPTANGLTASLTF